MLEANITTILDNADDTALLAGNEEELPINEVVK